MEEVVQHLALIGIEGDPLLQAGGLQPAQPAQQPLAQLRLEWLAPHHRHEGLIGAEGTGRPIDVDRIGGQPHPQALCTGLQQLLESGWTGLHLAAVEADHLWEIQERHAAQPPVRQSQASQGCRMELLLFLRRQLHRVGETHRMQITGDQSTGHQQVRTEATANPGFQFRDEAVTAEQLHLHRHTGMNGAERTGETWLAACSDPHRPQG